MKTVLAFDSEADVRYPAPGWAPLAWLVRPGRSAIPAIAEGLRSTLFRRMSSLVAASIANATMLLVAVIRHPERAVFAWVILGLSLDVVRLYLIVALKRAIGTRSLRRRRGLVDFFVGTSLLWGLQFGCSCFLCMGSGDSVIAVFSAVLAVGIVGALSARNPGCPRLTGTIMVCILVPLAAGHLTSPDPAMRLLALLSLPYFWAMWSINAQLHGDYVAMLTAQWENRRRALHCGLTGLPNASHFYERLGAAIAQEGNVQVSVLALDLDGFKGVNDRFGHPAGDTLLKLVAERIRGVEGPAVMGARIGGDEFAMVLRGLDDNAAEGLAAHLIDLIGRPYEVGGVSLAVTASVGIATSSGGPADPTALYAEADRALYRAKGEGKGVWRRSGDLPAAEDTATSALRPAEEARPEKARRHPADAGAETGDRVVIAA